MSANNAVKTPTAAVATEVVVAAAAESWVEARGALVCCGSSGACFGAFGSAVMWTRSEVCMVSSANRVCKSRKQKQSYERTSSVPLGIRSTPVVDASKYLTADSNNSRNTPQASQTCHNHSHNFVESASVSVEGARGSCRGIIEEEMLEPSRKGGVNTDNDSIVRKLAFCLWRLENAVQRSNFEVIS